MGKPMLSLRFVSVDSEIYIVVLLVAVPLFGVAALIFITLLTMQKIRLQTRLDDNNWWLIDYSDITIIKEAKVGYRPLLPACTEIRGV